MQAKRFTAPIQVKFASATGEVSGYASTFGNSDSYGDVIGRGAFKASLAQHKANGTMTKMLWQHDAAEPIGVWEEAFEDAHGLQVKGRFTMGTQRGAEAHALAKDGALGGLSIGFEAEDSRSENGMRVLTEIRLWEVSLVTFPANTEAKILSVKSANAADEIRSAVAFERFLKANGFANSLARKLAAGWNQAVGRQDADAAELLESIRARTRALTEDY